MTEHNAAHDLGTSNGSRAYLAAYFAKQIGRHDFKRYINEIIAADFACALAQHLSKLRAEGVQAGDERAAFARHVSGRNDLELYQVENVIDANSTRWATWRAARDYYQQTRAALASAPVAPGSALDAVQALEPPCASRRGNEFREGFLEAKVDAVRALRRVASAPVAGEAVGHVSRDSSVAHMQVNLPEGSPVYAAPQASEAVRDAAQKSARAIAFDVWLARHCDSDDLTAYERDLARDAWNTALSAPQASSEPVDLTGIDADHLLAISASGSHTAMSNALLNVARALKTQADKDGGDCAKGAGDERRAWEADMVAAGAQHLGGDCWEWDEPDFEFRLWQLASRRQRAALSPTQPTKQGERDE